MDAPKAFVSYSWSNPVHEQWVLDLATELRESGVDIILDKWDLKEGHDAIAFMEKMVTDPEIKKVIIIADKTYASKSDGRSGGVGTEAQIISKEIYDNQEQDKFVAVVSQKDEQGKAYLPTYYKSRIYIDLSEPDNYGENFEKLLRWIFDKPLYLKPDIGQRPSFVNDSETISLGTTANFKRAIDAIKNSKTFATGALEEYLKVYSENLEKIRIGEIEGEFDDAVFKSIEDFLPYRNEAIQIFSAIAQYGISDQNIQILHRFFESLIPYTNRPKNVKYWHDSSADNFRFIIHELFLYAMAILIRHERFEQANYLMEQRYYLPENSDYGRDVMSSFIFFRQYIKSLEHRNNRLNLRRLSLRADLLKNRCLGIGIEFRYLMQADFVLYLRAELEAPNRYATWWPETLLYLGDYNRPFEIFARAISKRYFDRVKCLLGIDLPSDLETLVNEYRENKRKIPQWQFESFNPVSLLGFNQLSTKP